jgi:hypothetical protein
MPQTPKQAAIELIQQLPDDASLDGIIEALCFRQKVDEGLAQLDAGEGIEHEEAKRRLSHWLS